ncbi:putative acyl-CoA dehydrogenase [Hyphomonas adhaerens MHS-3]|uniref:Putative acyl-CoA dehydrogenase n=1 Tax=Hyphomonas adhaerens MHS-3 TaxID=1280949 RepID=A0A069E7R5_9PROT|nr:acyl-CoA dehydrogenase family protein [Hyphomonas adhaerens]KCZ86143.1 putative acyl-CoA dehydrogenase [Hyphomonas adhaerens MHS-3]
MDFNLPGEDDPRRIKVRKWFEENPNPTYAQLAKQGWTASNWPEPWGVGADAEMQWIIDEEIVRAGLELPYTINAIALNQCGQSLLNYGTEAQRQKFLPGALACEEIWCMLFSEPSGGSDLGALRTTARREGDHYVVNGHKIWTSVADHASVGVLVARTDASKPKHSGLSMFLIDMKSPGVTVNPIIDMTGNKNEYNEVFLDNVKVPADALLGQEGEGWKLTMEQLQTERVGMTKPGVVWGMGPTARDLMNGLIETGRIRDPLLRDEAAKLYIEGEILRLLTYRNMTSRINGTPAGFEGSAGKMLSSPHGQRMADLAKRSQGVSGMIRNPDVLPLPEKKWGMFSNWDYAYWFSPANTLGVGTQEVLLNVVAERVLGLPRESDPTAKVPFSEISNTSAKAAKQVRQ